MEIVHKIQRGASQMFPMTECSRPLHIKGGTGVRQWEATTCKKCLKNIPKSRK